MTRRILTVVAWGLAGLAIAGGLIAGAFALAGEDIGRPASPVLPSATPSAEGSRSPEAERTETRTPQPGDDHGGNGEEPGDDHGGGTGSGDDHGGSDDSGSGSDNSGSGSDDSGSGSDDSGFDNSGSGSDDSGSGSDNSGSGSDDSGSDDHGDD